MMMTRNERSRRRTKGSAGATIVVAAVVLAVVVAAAPLAAQQLSGQRPAALPGSTPAVDGETRFYLSGRTFDEAVAHFRQLLGEPMSVAPDSRAGDPRAFFAYRSQSQPNQTTLFTGVRISEGNPENAVPLVLRELRTAVQRGHIAQARYDEIAAEYAPIANLFFASSVELGGPTRSVDTELFRRYQRFVRLGIWMEPEELQAEMMRIARSGDQEALNKLRAMIQPDVMRAQTLQATDAIVDHWLECLEEIRSLAPTHGYRLQIDMEHEVTVSADRKG